MSSPQLVPRLTSGQWTRGGSKGSTTTSSSQAVGLGAQALQATGAGGSLRGGGGSLTRGAAASLSRASLPRGSLSRTPQRNSSSRSARHLQQHQHSNNTLHARTAALDLDDEVSRRSSAPGTGQILSLFSIAVGWIFSTPRSCTVDLEGHNILKLNKTAYTSLMEMLVKSQNLHGTSEPSRGSTEFYVNILLKYNNIKKIYFQNFMSD